jgi:ribosomal protein L11 methyltransferase
MGAACGADTRLYSASLFAAEDHTMSWLQLQLVTDRHHSEALEEALLAAGACSVTLQDGADQPLFEPPPGATPLWDDIRLMGLFTADHDPQQLIDTVRAAFGAELPPHRIEILEDKDWIREWMDSYQPMQFGQRLWICPSWRTPPQPDAVNLMLDPGLAFGTGTHPTTALCLQWLDGLDLRGKTVIDFGCGSGILGIAALLLGAARVIAIDNDPQALLATRDNAARNGLAETQLEALLPHQAARDLVADVVVANILAAPLIALAPQLTAHLRAGGDIALSGILAEQAPVVRSAYEPAIHWGAQQQREDWIRLAGRKA